MKTFFKIIILLFLLTALILVTLYSLYKDELHEEIRTRLSSELSSLTGHNALIGNVKYVPFQSISLEHVIIKSKDEPGLILASVNNVIIIPDILTLLKQKQLQTTITLNGFHSGDILCNATLRTVSRKADSYKEILNPSLIHSASIIEATVGTPYFTLRKVFGILDIERLFISGGKIRFTYKETEYLLDFKKLSGDTPGYDITVRSDNLGFNSKITKENDSLIVNVLTGMFYTLYFDFKGEVVHPLSEEMICSLDGTMETKLDSLAVLPGKIGKFARNHPISGSLKSRIFLKTKEGKLHELELNSTVSANNMRIDKFRIQEITAKVSIENGKLSSPLINGLVYGGTLTAKFEMDLLAKNLMYLCSMTLNNVDFERLIRDLTGNKENVYGILQMDLSAKGSARDIDTVDGNGQITIEDADLGTMPILTPVLGDIYGAAQKYLPAIKPVKIDKASMSFEIKHRKIQTDDFLLHGEDITMNAEGYIDFDGNLDFLFENHLLQTSSEDEEWPIALRNAIVNFGRFLGKTRLTGTIKEPRWTK